MLSCSFPLENKIQSLVFYKPSNDQLYIGTGLSSTGCFNFTDTKITSQVAITVTNSANMELLIQVLDL